MNLTFFDNINALKKFFEKIFSFIRKLIKNMTNLTREKLILVQGEDYRSVLQTPMKVQT